MSVPIHTVADRLQLGTPRSLFRLKPRSSLMLASREGRFLVSVPRVEAGELPIVVSTLAVASVTP
jgi:hypothetical protein